MGDLNSHKEKVSRKMLPVPEPKQSFHIPSQKKKNFEEFGKYDLSLNKQNHKKGSRPITTPAASAKNLFNK